MNEDIKDIPVERSDDPRRGEMPHLKKAIQEGVALLKRAAAYCAKCGVARGTHIINMRIAPKLVCGGCAERYRAMTHLERRQMINDIARRA